MTNEENEFENKETNSQRLTLWQQIKEDFSVPKLNDPAFDSNFDIFFNSITSFFS